MEKTQSKFPNSWEVVPLGKFVENEKGKKPKNQKVNSDNSFKYAYVDIEAFEQGIIKSWTDGENCRFCYETDFLMVWDGSRSGLVGKGMNGALGSTLVRINFPKIENSYAYYFLQSNYQEINTRTKGSGTPHVDPDLLWNYEFPIAPLNEQKRIVVKVEELFSELDKGIESLKTAQEQLKVYRQAVLKHAFEGKLTADWREKNKDKLETAEELLKRFDCSSVDSNLPNGWITLKFKSVYEASQNGLSKRSGKTGRSIPVLRLADITNFNIVKNDLRSILLDEKEEAKYSLTDNDLLAIRVNGSPNLVGRMILAQDCSGMAYCDHFIRFTFDPSIILPEYAQHYFNTHKARRYIDLNKVSSAGQNTVSQATLGELDVPYCSLEEQEVLVKLLSEKFTYIDSATNEIEEQLKKAEALRQSILKKAFSGQLVEQNPNDEPASALLERIKAEKTQTEKSKKKSKRKNAA